MNQIGMRELETERLLLRRVRAEDAAVMFENWASDAQVTKYLTWSPHENPEATQALLSVWEKEYTRGDCYRWGLEEKATGELIGMLDVVRTEPEIESAIIGYCLSRKRWNQGLMTEAVSAVNRYLLQQAGFNRVEAYHHVDNAASGKVMLKSGMIYEGIRRQGAKDKKANYCDVAVYAILKKDLQP